MNWVIKMISKSLMTKISHVSWGVTTKAFTVTNLDKMYLQIKTYIFYLS